MKITDNKAIALSSILLMANIIFFILDLSIVAYILWPSLFVFTILNVYLLLQAMKEGEIKEKLIGLVSIYIVHIAFSFLLNLFINQNYVDKVSKLTLHADEILALRKFTSLLSNILYVFLSWSRFIVFTYMLRQRNKH